MIGASIKSMRVQGLRADYKLSDDQSTSSVVMTMNDGDDVEADALNSKLKDCHMKEILVNEVQIEYSQTVDRCVGIMWLASLSHINDDDILSADGFQRLFSLLSCAIFNLRDASQIMDNSNLITGAFNNITFQVLYEVFFKLAKYKCGNISYEDYSMYVCASICDFSLANKGIVRLMPKRKVTFVDINREVELIKLLKEKKRYFNYILDGDSKELVLTKEEKLRAMARKDGVELSNDESDTLLAIQRGFQRSDSELYHNIYEEGSMSSENISVDKVNNSLHQAGMDDSFITVMTGVSDYQDYESEIGKLPTINQNQFKRPSSPDESRASYTTRASNRSLNSNPINLFDLSRYTEGRRPESSGLSMQDLQIKKMGQRQTMNMSTMNMSNELTYKLVEREALICSATGSGVINMSGSARRFVETCTLSIQTSSNSLSASSFAPDVLTRSKSWFSDRGIVEARPLTSSIYSKPRQGDCRYGLMNQHIQYNQPFTRAVSREKEIETKIDSFASASFKDAVRVAYREGRKDYQRVVTPKHMTARSTNDKKVSSSSASSISSSNSIKKDVNSSLISNGNFDVDDENDDESVNSRVLGQKTDSQAMPHTTEGVKNQTSPMKKNSVCVIPEVPDHLTAATFESNRIASKEFRKLALKSSLYEPIESLFTKGKTPTKLDEVRQKSKINVEMKIQNLYKNKHTRQEKAPEYIVLSAPFLPSNQPISTKDYQMMSEAPLSEIKKSTKFKAKVPFPKALSTSYNEMKNLLSDDIDEESDYTNASQRYHLHSTGHVKAYSQSPINYDRRAESAFTGDDESVMTGASSATREELINILTESMQHHSVTKPIEAAKTIVAPK